MDYGHRLVGTVTSFTILSLICLGIDAVTPIVWYKMMSIMALWYACSANIGVSFLQEGVKTFASEVVTFLAKLPRNHDEKTD